MPTETKSILSEIIPTMSLILDYQGEGNLYHAWRVAITASHLAQEAIPEKRSLIFYSGLLHDIGAMGFEEHITVYPEITDQITATYIKNHPRNGAYIVSEIPGLIEASEVILNHHEWWNGKGYPNAKKGDEIPLGSQILRIADSFDLLLRKEPKPNMTMVYDYFRTKAGKEYSRDLWPAILKIKSKNGGSIFYELYDEKSIPSVFAKVIVTIPDIPLKDSQNFIEIALRIIGRIVDAKHTYTNGHTERVARYSEGIAKMMGLSDKEVKDIKFSAYLHDIGKVAVPREILDKRGKLNREEQEVVQRHPILSMEIIDSMESLRHLSPSAGHHHERYDGAGYPDSLRGDEIPLGARIIGVADTIDAMTSTRAYRNALGFEKVLSELRTYAGTQFDPKVAVAASEYIEELMKEETLPLPSQ